MAIRVYALEADGYGGSSFVRIGRRFTTRVSAFRLLGRKTAGYVTDDSSGKELAIKWKGLLRGVPESVVTTGSMMVRV